MKKRKRAKVKNIDISNFSESSHKVRYPTPPLPDDIPGASRLNSYKFLLTKNSTVVNRHHAVRVSK